MPRERFSDYVEWSSMIHALRAAGEGEDFDYYAEEDLDLTPEEFDSLTSKRIELLDYLADEHVSSINSLAERVNRDVKNVYGDLRALEAPRLHSPRERRKEPRSRVARTGSDDSPRLAVNIISG